jgi:DNA-binding HxlR family transcriptional regulator
MRIMENEQAITAFCPAFHKSVELIGKRWTGAILRAMRSGCVRFSDISDSIPGLHDRLLSERLKELESEGIVHRLVIPEMPVRIEYRLTAKGSALDSVMDAISQWAHDWISLTPEDQESHLAAAIAGVQMSETLTR